MPALTRTELIEILSSARFADIIGTEEGQQIEFKGHAYNLQIPKDRSDLVADIASFANGKGGTIVLGVETVIVATSKREVADRVVGIPPGSVDDDAYQKLVRAHVRPLVRQFEVRRYLEGARGRELIALHVDPQDEWDMPFIVDRIVDDNRPQKEVGHAVGWPTRSAADTYWEDPSRIQQLISIGLRRPATETARDLPSDTEATDQLSYIEERLADWGVLSSFSIQAVPLPGHALIEDFYGTFAQKMRRWQSTRQHGFGLALTAAPVVPIESWLGLVDEAGPSVIVGRTGTVTAAAAISPDFLGWNQTFTAELLVINQTAFVEFLTETVRFAYEAVQPELDDVREWRFRCRADGWQGDSGQVVLAARPLPFLKIRYPTSNSFEVEVSGTGDTWQDAATVVTAVLGRGFGVAQADVPYVSDGRIDLLSIPDG
ncbi:MAG TPA: ATP-binding protein [Acidimicrobiales bacterium]|jgi:hypothetical protein|nr:ATP-binding protein [Acidimicrobiales bacterium]